ncbi:MAG TPA: LapA family protein [Casimicrobiaceae bacterium]|nr:LapA family protein [Casimicrobiaceae bacterium]
MVSVVRFLVAALVFIALLLLALSNTEPVTLRFFQVADHESPLAFVVFVAFATGVATGLVAGAARSARLKRQLNRLRHELRAAAPTPAPHGAIPGSYPASPPPPRDFV